MCLFFLVHTHTHTHTHTHSHTHYNYHYISLYIVQYEYEMDSNGDRVMLGKGSFGAVYSAIDLVTKRKMAVKELNDTG